MTKKVILTGQHGRPSMKKVYSLMSSAVLVERIKVFNNTGEEVRRYYTSFSNNDINCSVEENFFDVGNSILIRWGTRADLSADASSIVYNSSNAIETAVNKKLSREIFSKSGVSAPMLIGPHSFEDQFLPVIARPSHHSEGADVELFYTEEEFNVHYEKNREGWYYSQYLNKNREFRVHCAHGKVLAVLEKSKPMNGNVVWNRSANETQPFKLMSCDEIESQELGGVLEEALKATDSVGLDMSGADVMLYNGKAYVVEVNTAQTLHTSEYVSLRWAAYFDWLFMSNVKREHFPIGAYDDVRGMIWQDTAFLE
jgi:predicted ATP-grasp superfamily ATP-dependent carboligase